MVEFSISNQLLSRLDATKVVADSENYLECAFRFSRDWDGTVAVATFGHSKVSEPISVRIVDGKCRVPHEVIQPYGFQVAVYGTAGEEGEAVCRIPTNVVTVEVENSGPGQDLGPTQPTKSLYDSLMTAILEGEAEVAGAKTSALASAEMALGAKKGAEQALDKANQAVQNAAVSATASAKDALTTRELCQDAMPAAKQVVALLKQVRDYVMGGGEEQVVRTTSNITWTDGAMQVGCMFLDPEKRYRVRVDGTWYDTPAQWVLEETCKVKEGDQAELTEASTLAWLDPTETPETPGGDEVKPGGNTGGSTGDNTGSGGDNTGTGGDNTGTGGDNTGSGGNTGSGTGGGDETPEVPGGDDAKPGGDGGTAVTPPTLRYKRVKDMVRLVAGPVTVEDIMVNKETGESQVCWLRSTDPTVRTVEVRTVGDENARYFYQQAMEAAARAEAAAAKMGV